MGLRMWRFSQGGESMRIRKSISNKIQSFSESIAKETVYRIVMFAGIALTGYGIYLQDIAIIISGSALIAASVIGIVMSMQTNKIAGNLYNRIDKQTALLESSLNKMVAVLERMDKKLDKLDTIDTKLDKLDTIDTKLDNIDKKMD